MKSLVGSEHLHLLPSLLTQESGLKCLWEWLRNNGYASLLTQESGLKFWNAAMYGVVSMVSPYTGEWIEILEEYSEICPTWGLSLHRRVD